MREIKFRGRTTDTKKWVHGYFCEESNFFFIRDNNQDFEVDPKTVGQLIGIKDSEGVECYEGDVIYSEMFPNLELAWCEESSCYIAKRMGKLILPSYGLSILAKKNVFKIIGNVHDNPDLLEGEG